MEKLTFDFTNEEYDDYEVIPEGIYKGIVKNSELKLGKHSNEKYIEWIFMISEGEYKGKKISCNTTCIKGKRFMLFSFFEVFDIDHKDKQYFTLFEKRDNRLFLSGVDGKECWLKIVVIKSDFSNYNKNEIKKIYKEYPIVKVVKEDKNTENIEFKL